jgi:hypothetical protein
MEVEMLLLRNFNALIQTGMARWASPPLPNLTLYFELLGLTQL